MYCPSSNNPAGSQPNPIQFNPIQSNPIQSNPNPRHKVKKKKAAKSRKTPVRGKKEREEVSHAPTEKKKNVKAVLPFLAPFGPCREAASAAIDGRNIPFRRQRNGGF